jgi:hypothetical protein
MSAHDIMAQPRMAMRREPALFPCASMVPPSHFFGMMSSRRIPMLFASLLLAGLAGCSGLLDVEDNSGASYAQLRGTVTRANGTPVTRTEIGVSCVGSTPDAFGLTTETDNAGRFELTVVAPAGFPPLEGNTRLCRVLTPVTGTPAATVTVTVVFSGTVATRPVTNVTLVLP